MAGLRFSRRRVGRIDALDGRQLQAMGLILLVPVLAAPRGAAAQEGTPVFTFSVSCLGEIRSAPGETFQRELDVILDTSENPGDVGAQGWSLQVVSEGVRITSITTRGTLPEELAGCSGGSIPVGECPIRNQLMECRGRTSAVSVALLSYTRPVTLPPAGPVTVARIRIEGEAPETQGGTAEAKLEFVGSCPGSELPAVNLITWQGRTLTARLESCAFTIVASEPVFRRGEVNGDGQVDIADPIYLLGCKFHGTACPTCWDAADANDDGESDVSDAIAILGYIFLAGVPPPPPGPFECGADATADELPACAGSCSS